MLCGCVWSCWVAAVCSVVSDVLSFVALAVYFNKSSFMDDFDVYKQLDPKIIQEDWAVRNDLRGLETAAAFFSAVSWLVFAIPGLQMILILHNRNNQLVGLHLAMATMLLMGASIEFISQVMYIGTLSALEWISKDFNLSYWTAEFGTPDNTGWRTLEVVHIALHGTLLYINSVEFFFLGTLLFLLYLSIQRQLELSTKFLGLGFGRYGLFLCWICLAEFLFEILRFKSWGFFSFLVFCITLVSRLILWPIWYIWLGRLLGRYSAPLDPQSGSIGLMTGSSTPGAPTESEMTQFQQPTLQRNDSDDQPGNPPGTVVSPKEMTSNSDQDDGLFDSPLT